MYISSMSLNFAYFSTAFSYIIEESNDIFFSRAFNSSKIYFLHNSSVSPCVVPLPSAILFNKDNYKFIIIFTLFTVT